MADFTVEGIIEVDASRAIRSITRFQSKLKTLTKDLTNVDRQIKRLDGKTVNVEVEFSKKPVEDFKKDVERMRKARPIQVRTALNASDTRAEFNKLLAELRRRKAVTIKVDPDFNNLKTQFGEQVKKMRRTASIKIPVEVNSVKALKQLRDLVREMKAMALERGPIRIAIELSGGAAAIAEAERLRRELEAIARSRTRARIDVDTSALSKLQTALGGLSAASSAAGSMFLLASAITAVVAATGPLIAMLGAGSAGLLGSLGVLGTGVGAFAALAIPTFKGVAEAVKLLNKETSGMSPEKLQVYLEQVKQLKTGNPAIYKAALGFMALKKEYSGFAKQLQPKVLNIIGKGFRSLSLILRLIAPVAQAAANGISDLLTSLNKNLKSDDVVAFFTYVRKNIREFINVWGQAIGNFIVGVMNMIRAFDPLTKMFNGGLLSMSQRFREWSANLGENPGFKKFVNFVKENWPKIKQAFNQIGGAVKNLLIMLAPLGVTILVVAGKIAELYNNWAKTNPEMAQTVTHIAALTLLLSPLLGLIGPLIAAFSGIVTVMTGLAGLFGGTAAATGAAGGAAAAATAPISGLAIAIGAVIAAAIALTGGLAFAQKKTANYKKMMDSFKGTLKEVKKTFKAFGQQAKWVWERLKDTGAGSQMQATFKNISDAVGDLMPVLKILGAIIAGTVVVAFTALAYAIRFTTGLLAGIVAIVSKIVQAIAWPFEWLYNHLVGNSVIPDMVNGIIKWFLKLPAKLPGMILGLVGKVGAFFERMRAKAVSLAGRMASVVIGKIGNLVTGSVNWLRGLPGKAAGFFLEMNRNLFGKVENMRRTIVSKFGAIVTGAREKLVNIKSTITGFFSGAGTWLLNIGSSIIDGLVKGMKSAWDKGKDWIGGLGGAIVDLKGPPSYDKVMLTPNGRLIMDGLIAGMKQGQAPLNNTLNSITRQIANQPFNARAAISGSGVGSAVGSAFGGGGNNYYHIVLEVPVGASSIEIGKTLVGHIDAYEKSGGRRRKKS